MTHCRSNEFRELHQTMSPTVRTESSGFQKFTVGNQLREHTFLATLKVYLRRMR